MLLTRFPGRAAKPESDRLKWPVKTKADALTVSQRADVKERKLGKAWMIGLQRLDFNQ
jgi:hypothetical protein